MGKRIRNPFSSRSLQSTLRTAARTTARLGTKLVTQALRQSGPKAPKWAVAKKVKLQRGGSKKSPGFVTGTSGALRYRFFKPPGVKPNERLALMVMLHGCDQDAQQLSASTRMNQMAVRERFLVLYPEQSRFANLQGCWNWYETRLGKAQSEADAIAAAIDQICRTQPVDTARIALAGLSAGAAMAALMATRQPTRFRAIAMHSGVAPGIAHSPATALSAMRGRRVAVPIAPLSDGAHLPALLVIQGSADPVIAPTNGVLAARLWATREGALPTPPRTVQRGQRYPATLTDYRAEGRLVTTLCEISGLGHAWSGGAARHAYSDPKGPDASRMIWSFAAKQFDICVA